MEKNNEAEKWEKGEWKRDGAEEERLNIGPCTVLDESCARKSIKDSVETVIYNDFNTIRTGREISVSAVCSSSCYQSEMKAFSAAAAVVWFGEDGGE